MKCKANYSVADCHHHHTSSGCETSTLSSLKVKYSNHFTMPTCNWPIRLQSARLLNLFETCEQLETFHEKIEVTQLTMDWICYNRWRMKQSSEVFLKFCYAWIRGARDEERDHWDRIFSKQFRVVTLSDLHWQLCQLNRVDAAQKWLCWVPCVLKWMWSKRETCKYLSKCLPWCHVMFWWWYIVHGLHVPSYSVQEHGSIEWLLSTIL